jgi:hypothetical protein
MSSKHNTNVNTNYYKTELIKFLESEKIRLEKELKKVQRKKIKIENELDTEQNIKLEKEKLEKERIAHIAYLKEKKVLEEVKINERRERQKLAAEKSGGGDGFSSRGKRLIREENDKSDEEELDIRRSNIRTRY